MVDSPNLKIFYFTPGIIQVEENLFEVLDVRGGSFRTNLKGIAIFLCAKGSYGLTRIKKEVNHFGISATIEEVKDFTDELIQNRFLMIGDNEEAIKESYDAGRVMRVCLSPFSAPRAVAIRNIEISIGQACPYKCLGCYANAGQVSEKEIAISHFKEAIHDAYELGATSLSITGGEPLLERYATKTLELIRCAAELDMETTLLTTGFNLENYVEKLKRAGLHKMQFSLHSLSNYNDEYMGIEGAKESILKAIDCAQAAGFQTYVNCVVTKQNIKELIQIMNYVTSKKVHGLRFSSLRPLGRGNQNKALCLSVAEKRNLFHFVQENKQKISIKDFTCTFVRDGAYDAPIMCDVGLTFAFINHDGEVLMCNNLPLSAGNITRKSFKQIWMYSDAYAPFRKIVPINPKCGHCQDREFCVSKCPGTAYEMFNQLKMEKEPCCTY